MFTFDQKHALKDARNYGCANGLNAKEKIYCLEHVLRTRVTDQRNNGIIFQAVKRLNGSPKMTASRMNGGKEQLLHFA